MHITHVYLEVVEPLFEGVRPQLCAELLPDLLLKFLQPLIDVSFQNELLLVFVSLVYLAFKSDDFGLQSKSGAFPL